MSSEYRAALDAALREYERLWAERDKTNARLDELKASITTLARLCGLVPTVPLGLTDACRLVLRGARAPMTAIEIREHLNSIGFDTSKYANALAAVHTVLRRLTESGEVAPTDDETRRAYEFLNSGIVASRTFVPTPNPTGRAIKPKRPGPRQRGGRQP